MFLFVRTALALLAVFISLAAANAQNLLRQKSVLKEYVIPGTVPSLKLHVLYIANIKPKPTVGVILLAGGNGAVNINTTTLEPGDDLKNNFLIRNRSLFAQRGVMVAVVDWGPNGVNHNARLTKGHADIVSKLIALIRKEPGYEADRLWLVGTSSSTLSVGNTAANYPLQTVVFDPTSPASTINDGRPNGIVLTSTLTTKFPDSRAATTCEVTIDNVVPKLSVINVPAHVMWNKTDQCGCSPGAPPVPPDVNYPAQSVLAKLGNSPRYLRVGHAYNGPGDPNVLDQCTAKTAHGFLGIDETVVADIVYAVTH